MFGVVPKMLWQKTNPANEKNLITLAMRTLLIEDGKRLILIDNGIGHKYDDKFKSIYDIDHSSNTLEKSLAKRGFSMDDVTDMFLTHLHFDHCGGSTKRDANGKFIPAFNNATYYIQEEHWNWAINPNPREKASFFREENLLPLEQSGRLKKIKNDTSLGIENFSFLIVNGHTRGMQLPKIQYKGKTIVYVTDLIPTHGHVPLAYIMGYDMFPVTTLGEKEKFLNEASDKEWLIFYEHDPNIECSLIQRNERGGFVRGEVLKLSDL